MNYKKTIENVETYLLMRKTAHKDLDEDDRSSYIYDTQNFLGRITVYETLEYLSVKIYPGIMIPSEFIPMASEYCQHILPEIGSVTVNDILKTVQYKVDIPYTDNPVSCDTLRIIELYGEHIFELYGKALKDISYGKNPILNLKTYKMENSASDQCNMDKDAAESLKNIENYIEQKNAFAAYRKNFGTDSNDLYWIDIADGNDTFSFRISVTPDKNFLTAAMYLGIGKYHVEDPYKYMTSQLCSKINSKMKVGVLSISEGINVKVNISLCDGIITANTIEKVEHLLYFTLKNHKKELEYISNGILVTEEEPNDVSIIDKIDMIKKLSEIRTLRDSIESLTDSDDSDDSEIDSETPDYKSFLDFLREHTAKQE